MRIKHKELWEWYHKQDEPKAKYSVFCNRVLHYGWDKEKAIIAESFKIDNNKQRIERCKRRRRCNIVEVNPDFY